jgi:hypothetical protein
VPGRLFFTPLQASERRVAKLMIDVAPDCSAMPSAEA